MLKFYHQRFIMGGEDENCWHEGLNFNYGHPQTNFWVIRVDCGHIFRNAAVILKFSKINISWTKDHFISIPRLKFSYFFIKYLVLFQ